MDVVIVIGGAILLLAGIVGCVAPVIPGPPISYGALLLLLLHKSASSSLTPRLLIILGVAVALVTLIDFLLPIWGTKRSGGTKAGQNGSLAGLILALIFPILGPFTLLVGPFIGAFAGEILVGQTRNVALKSAIGSFLGFLAGTFAKLVVCGFITFYFIWALV